MVYALCMNTKDKPKNGNGYSLYRGVPVSKVQLRLAERLRVPEKYINFKVGPYYIDVALPRYRIAIEYNGWFWHDSADKKQWCRTGYLLDKGWNIIIIKGRAEVPTMAILKQALYNARHGHRYQEVILSDWPRS